MIDEMKRQKDVYKRQGKQFKGVYDRNSKEVMTFADTLNGTKEGSEKIIHIDDPALSDEIGEEFKSQLMDEIELLDEMCIRDRDQADW